MFLSLAKKHLYEFRTLTPQIHWPVIKNGRSVLSLLIISELIIGALFVLGLYTQIAALMSIGLCKKILIWHNRFPANSIPSKLSLVLLLAISASLLITGAGVLAFDLPI